MTEVVEDAAPRWGLGDFFAGFFIGLAATVVGQMVALAASGHLKDPEHLELSWIAFTQACLWVGFLGVPLWASARKGAGLVRDFGLRMVASDAPLGIVIGVASQFAIGLVYLPLIEALGKSQSDLEKPARELSEKAHGALGVTLLVLIVGVGAPIVEEIFYRGLLHRSLVRRMPAPAAIVLGGLIFGATHFEPLQFAALAAFGMLLGTITLRTGRLGLNIWAHVGFNMLTVIGLLA